MFKLPVADCSSALYPRALVVLDELEGGVNISLRGFNLKTNSNCSNKLNVVAYIHTYIHTKVAFKRMGYQRDTFSFYFLYLALKGVAV